MHRFGAHAQRDSLGDGQPARWVLCLTLRRLGGSTCLLSCENFRPRGLSWAFTPASNDVQPSRAILFAVSFVGVSCELPPSGTGGRQGASRLRVMQRLTSGACRSEECHETETVRHKLSGRPHHRQRSGGGIHRTEPQRIRTVAVGFNDDHDDINDTNQRPETSGSYGRLLTLLGAGPAGTGGARVAGPTATPAAAGSRAAAPASETRSATRTPTGQTMYVRPLTPAVAACYGPYQRPACHLGAFTGGTAIVIDSVGCGVGA